jgi:hypothetical protein
VRFEASSFAQEWRSALPHPRPRPTAESVSLRRDLDAVGIKWSAVRKVLPDWAEEAVSGKAGVLELTGFMIRHLWLELDTEGRLRRRILPDQVRV